MESMKKHVVLFPWMGKSHLIPFAQLAQVIERRKAYTVTIVNTPANILTLRSFLPSSSTIHLVDLPFNPTDHGLNPGSESTDGLPNDHFLRFFQATETLRPAFDLFLSDTIARSPPGSTLCIISDLFHTWTVETAKNLNVFHSVFSVTNAYGQGLLLSLVWDLPHTSPDSDGYFSLPNHPKILLHRSQIPKLLLSPDKNRPQIDIFRRHVAYCRRSGGFLVNNAEAFEGAAGADVIKRELGIPVWTVGPLLRLPSSSDSHWNVRGWLGSHPPESVVYVSFGSMCTISASQMVELAMGLEASETGFVWMVRPPVGFDFNGEFRADEWLPEGFEERMREKKRGIVVRGWAPQQEILSHASTGAFLSQCGWNSVLESLTNGVPLIGWPIEFEQSINVKMLEEEKGVCVEVARGNDSAVDRVHVEKTIRSVVGRKGEEMRRKAREFGRALREAVEEGGASVRAMDDFLHTALSTVVGTKD
ncbi:UDP-glycosyltransferase 92A1 [Acorus calamus]|uniref:Glycosyltransferase n=1 Tax=Acorus calamus TaxID=4465 RepID=A0AAV9DZP7_ACOCL|nr:UDP-glycosyltransferase 92A1 [Acorus calamus]